MDDFSKLSDEELNNIKLRKPAPNSTTREVDTEIHRRMQEKNILQTTTLIEEIKELRQITNDNTVLSKMNADSANRLSRAAFWVAVVAAIFTVLQVKIEVSIPRQCHQSGDNGVAFWEYCENYIRFGAYEFQWNNNPKSLQ